MYFKFNLNCQLYTIYAIIYINSSHMYHLLNIYTIIYNYLLINLISVFMHCLFYHGEHNCL